MLRRWALPGVGPPGGKAAAKFDRGVPGSFDDHLAVHHGFQRIRDEFFCVGGGKGGLL
jgi:hypothetical protein